jgi:hypothetical protein
MVSLTQLKVSQAIVGSVSIPVMDGLSLDEGAPKGICHDKAMFLDVAGGVRVWMLRPVNLPIPLPGHDSLAYSGRRGTTINSHVVASHEGCGISAVKATSYASCGRDNRPSSAPAFAQSRALLHLGWDGFPFSSHP